MRYAQIEPGRVWVSEGARPGPLEPGMVRVRVGACGLCASDAHMARGMKLPRGVEYPVRPGHEVAGTILEVGPGEPGEPALAPGVEVVLHPLEPCGRCQACLAGHEEQCRSARVLGIHDPGGMAEEVVWPGRRMVVAAGLPAWQAALLPDAVATAHHAVRLAELPARGRLCVLGAGGVGSHALELAIALHPHLRVAAVVRSEASAARLRAAHVPVEVGLDGSASRLRARYGRFDAVIDFTGAAGAAAEGARMLDVGGRLVLGSIVDEPIDLGTTVTGVVTRSLRVLGCYVSTLEDLREVTALAQAGRLALGGAVSHRLPLEEAPRAFSMLEERPPGLLRMVLEP
ncbi:MAG: alcohol dehydrogenase catalytic domain-containing protein [Candidatus Dormibacteraceae bacterium]